MGLLDGLIGGRFSDDPQKDEAMRMAMLAASLGMLTGRGNFGQIAGQAGMQGLGMYGGVMEASRRAQQEAEDRAERKRMHDLQIQQAQMSMEQAKRAQEMEAKRSQLMPQFFQPSQQVPVGPSMEEPGGMAQTPPRQDLQGYALALANAGDPSALGMLPKPRERKLSRIEPMMLGGKLVNVQFYDDGTREILPFGVKPDYKMQDVGGSVVPVDMNAPPQSGLTKSMTPGEVASNEVARGNLDVARGNLGVNRSRLGLEGARVGLDRERLGLEKQNAARGNWKIIPESGLQVNELTGETRPMTAGGQPIGTPAQIKRKAGAQTVLDILDEAEPLIKDATGSAAGAATDYLLGTIGQTTPGAEKIAKLRALEGALMMAQPRMEGPQSNYDVQVYKQMAGQIGDPMVPRKAKLAAIKTIRSLNEKYKGGGSSGGATIDFSTLPE